MTLSISSNKILLNQDVFIQEKSPWNYYLQEYALKVIFYMVKVNFNFVLGEIS